MKGKRREINTGRYLGWSLVASVILGLLVGSIADGVVWYIVTSLIVAAVAFFLLFWAGVIVAAVCGMTFKGSEPEPAVEVSETSGYRRRRRRKRRKQHKKKVDKIDDELDYDYIYGKGMYESTGFKGYKGILERLREERRY